MTIRKIFESNILLFGYGKMGGALLDGWKNSGLKLKNTYVFEPNPSEELLNLVESGANLNPTAPIEAGICILAVKPQVVDKLLSFFPKNVTFPLLISVIAGTPLSKFKSAFGSEVSIFRVMPNTPALVSAGISAIYGESNIKREDFEKVEILMSAVGTTVLLDNEQAIDAVTAISGSGPAYTFLMIEAMANTGVELGLSYETSLKLAKNTVFGSGKLSLQVNLSPQTLRENVTSPGGTTEAALNILLNKDKFRLTMKEAIKSAHQKSIELRGLVKS